MCKSYTIFYKSFFNSFISINYSKKGQSRLINSWPIWEVCIECESASRDDRLQNTEIMGCISGHVIEDILVKESKTLALFTLPPSLVLSLNRRSFSVPASALFSNRWRMSLVGLALLIIIGRFLFLRTSGLHEFCKAGEVSFQRQKNTDSQSRKRYSSVSHPHPLLPMTISTLMPHSRYLGWGFWDLEKLRYYPSELKKLSFINLKITQSDVWFAEND